MPKQAQKKQGFGRKFRSNLTADQLKVLIALREDGQAWKVVLKETGLSHSKAELAMMEHEAEAAEFTVTELTPEFVSYARNELRIGWGPIMVWTQSSEGKVRKAWEQATNVHSDCTRIGRGGRFKFDDATLYVGDLKPVGTYVDADQPLIREVAREAAVDQSLTTKLMGMEMKDLRALATERGVVFTPKTTKAKLIVEIKKAVVNA